MFYLGKLCQCCSFYLIVLIKPINQNYRSVRRETHEPGHTFVFQNYANKHLHTTLPNKVETS